MTPAERDLIDAMEDYERHARSGSRTPAGAESWQRLQAAERAVKPHAEMTGEERSILYRKYREGY